MSAPKNNKFALGNSGGRPPHYETPEDLLDKVIEYFDWIEGEYEIVNNPSSSDSSHLENEEGFTVTLPSSPQERAVLSITTKDENGQLVIQEKIWIRYPESPTVTGLSLFLGFESRSTLYDYAKKEEFSYIIKRAIHVVENSYEEGLREKACAGQIFALKNMGWEDRKKQDIDQKNKITVEGVSNEELGNIIKD